MPTFSRHVTVDWQGPLREGGKGTAKAGSGAFSLPVSFLRRIGEPEGTTSPEELIAAAHASCYAMSINAAAGRKGGAIGTTHVTCEVSADMGESGIKITTSKLTVVAEGLRGIEPGAFEELARDAETKCPVSNALRGALTITVDASVK